MTVDPKFLRYRFHRRLEWKEAEDGKMVVFRPRFGEGRIAQWLESLLGLSPYRIRLDEIGGLVWSNCDGKMSAQEIADKLRDQFGEKIEPAEERLQHFILQMSRARMVSVEKE
jgi:hypothetical protein